jgi:hypothetical protein
MGVIRPGGPAWLSKAACQDLAEMAHRPGSPRPTATRPARNGVHAWPRARTARGPADRARVRRRAAAGRPATRSSPPCPTTFGTAACQGVARQLAPKREGDGGGAALTGVHGDAASVVDGDGRKAPEADLPNGGCVRKLPRRRNGGGSHSSWLTKGRAPAAARQRHGGAPVNGGRRQRFLAQPQDSAVL